MLLSGAMMACRPVSRECLMTPGNVVASRKHCQLWSGAMMARAASLEACMIAAGDLVMGEVMREADGAVGRRVEATIAVQGAMGMCTVCCWPRRS